MLREKITARQKVTACADGTRRGIHGYQSSTTPIGAAFHDVHYDDLYIYICYSYLEQQYRSSEAWNMHILIIS